MNKSAKRDFFLIASGLVIMCGSVFFITFGYDGILHWLHLDVSHSRSKLAEVREVNESSARRKEFLTPEFRPLRNKQAVFSNDTVMTGHESGLVLNFMDGSKVELAPDTMVEIQARSNSSDGDTFHFEITVSKGTVKGTSPEKTIQVKQIDNPVVQVLLPAATPLPVPTQSPASLPPDTSASISAQVTTSPTPQTAASPSALATEILTKPTPAKSMEIDFDFSYVTHPKAPIKKNEKKLPDGPQIQTGFTPALGIPPEGAIVENEFGEDLLFTWSYGEEPITFLFELSANTDMTDPVYSTQTKLNFTKVNSISPGIYYWRVINQETKQKTPTRKLILK